MLNKILLFTLSVCISVQILNAQKDTCLTKASESITSGELLEWVKEMTHPKYKGRLSGSPEYMHIAEWCAAFLKQWGIKPAGDNGTYLQYFYRPWCNVKDVGEIELINGNNSRKLQVKDEFYPGANSANGTVKAPLVFAGYGITFPEMGYDDYANIDVNGKIVLLAADVPYKGNNADTAALWTFYNSHKYKYTNAFEQGAVGVLLVEMLASPATPHFENFFYATVSTDIADYIFKTEGLNYDSIVRMISKSMQPHSFPTGFEVKISTNIECFPHGVSANVIGYIKGADPLLKHETIIIGAHLDGQGYLGFLLPGALDNASGVANVLAAAKALAMLKGKMKRSVLIILFGGEECGLLGSLHYIENPFIPLENTILMINLDMVGNGKGLAAWGAQSYPEIYQKFVQANEIYIGRPFRSSENRPVKGRPRTDGLVFLMHGIPTVHLGITDREFPIYYHNHNDSFEVLSYQTMADAAKWLFISVFLLANQ